MELNFNVTLEEANVIMAGLGELPAKVSAALITKLFCLFQDHELIAKVDPEAFEEIDEIL